MWGYQLDQFCGMWVCGMYRRKISRKATEKRKKHHSDLGGFQAQLHEGVALLQLGGSACEIAHWLFYFVFAFCYSN